MAMQRHCNHLRRASRQGGIAIVEFLICLPVVLFITLGVAEMANGIRQYNALTQSVRDGARYLTVAAKRGSTGTYSVTGTTVTEVANLVAYGSTGPGTPRLPGLTPGNVFVTDLGNREVSVRVAYDYQPLLIGGIPNLRGTGATGGTFVINAEVIMRVL